MKAATKIVFALFALPFAFAKVGDECTYKNLKGTCKGVSECTTGKKFPYTWGFLCTYEKEKEEIFFCHTL